MALGCHITLYSNPEPIIQIIKDNNLREVSNIQASDIFDNTRVFVNGDFLGIHETPMLLLKILKHNRRNGLINPYTSISWNIAENTIEVYTKTEDVVNLIYS